MNRAGAPEPVNDLVRNRRGLHAIHHAGEQRRVSFAVGPRHRGDQPLEHRLAHPDQRVGERPRDRRRPRDPDNLRGPALRVDALAGERAGPVELTRGAGRPGAPQREPRQCDAIGKAHRRLGGQRDLCLPHQPYAARRHFGEQHQLPVGALRGDFRHRGLGLGQLIGMGGRQIGGACSEAGRVQRRPEEEHSQHEEEVGRGQVAQQRQAGDRDGQRQQPCQGRQRRLRPVGPDDAEQIEQGQNHEGPAAEVLQAAGPKLGERGARLHSSPGSTGKA